MLVSDWDTSLLPPRQQFDFVRESLRGAAMPFRIERPGIAADAPFNCAMRTDIFGEGAYGISSRTDWLVGLREHDQIVRSAGDFIWVWRSMSRTARMRVGGVDHVLGVGDLVFGNAGTMIEDAEGQRINYTLWIFARDHFADVEGFARDEPSGAIAANTGVGALASNYVGHLLAALEQAPPDGVSTLVGQLGSLMALARRSSTDARERAVGAIDDARLRAVRRYIDAHFVDPALSPAAAAAAHGISVRMLHLLFEPTGRSFARHLIDRRLLAAHDRLAAGPVSTVADVAFGCGFESLSTFYRAFRARYGYSPAELRMGR